MGRSSPFVVGTCKTICPITEINMRKSRNLTHFYEKNGKYVKEFLRSAADKKMEKPEQIRTFEALRETLEYLFNIILQDSQKPLNFRYDFIFDRCRAVRQEIVMQNFSCEKTVALLEPIVMFLSYSLYQLNGLSISLFDSRICTQHLLECLQKCIACYEDIHYHVVDDGSFKMQNRVFIEAIFLVLNINERSALQHALKLDQKLKSTFILRTAIQIAISWHQRSFHKLLHVIRDLPHLVGAVASLNLSMIRKEVFRVFSIAYNNQTLKVPLEFLQRLLIYDDLTSLASHLRDLGISSGSDEDDNEIAAVVFNRKNFDSSKNICNTRQHFVDEKLCNYHLPDLILLRNF